MQMTTKNNKALDRHMLDFRNWANRVIYWVEKKYPKADVNPKLLMQLYLAGISATMAKEVFIQKHRLKGGS